MTAKQGFTVTSTEGLTAKCATAFGLIIGMRVMAFLWLFACTFYGEWVSRMVVMLCNEWSIATNEP